MARRNSPYLDYIRGRRARKRASAKPVPTVPEAVTRYQAMRAGPGHYTVHKYTAKGFAGIAAGPFDTREEAQAWVDEQ